MGAEWKNRPEGFKREAAEPARSSKDRSLTDIAHSPGIRPETPRKRIRDDSGRRPPGNRPPVSSARRRRTHPTRRAVDRALARSRAPVERGMARLKSWRIFRRSRITPNRMTSIAAAYFSPWRRR